METDEQNLLSTTYTIDMNDVSYVYVFISDQCKLLKHYTKSCSFDFKFLRSGRYFLLKCYVNIFLRGTQKTSRIYKMFAFLYQNQLVLTKILENGRLVQN
jgi:hypothetical protein